MSYELSFYLSFQKLTAFPFFNLYFSSAQKVSLDVTPPFKKITCYFHFGVYLSMDYTYCHIFLWGFYKLNSLRWMLASTTTWLGGPYSHILVDVLLNLLLVCFCKPGPMLPNDILFFICSVLVIRSGSYFNLLSVSSISICDKQIRNKMGSLKILS